MNSLDLTVYFYNISEEQLQKLFPLENRREFKVEIIDLESPYGAINKVIDTCATKYALFCEQNLWIGKNGSSWFNQMIQKVSEKFPYFGVIGGQGPRFDGERIYNVLRKPPINPEPLLFTKPTYVVGKGALLLPVEHLKNMGFYLSELNDFKIYDVVLSIELLKVNLLPIIDSGIVVSYFPEIPETLVDYQTSAELMEYLKNIKELRLTTHLGNIEVLDQTYGELYLPTPSQNRASIVSLFENSFLKNIDSIPTIEIITRSKLCNERQYLLDRQITSVASAAIEISPWAKLSYRIVTDSHKDLAVKANDEIKSKYPFLDVYVDFIEEDSNRFSRVNLLRRGIEKSQADYIHFVDDDDFVYSPSYSIVGKALNCCHGAMIVGQTIRYNEEWSEDGVLVNSKYFDNMYANYIYRVFTGENYTPICSVLFPAKILKERYLKRFSTGDYSEDYFMLLECLTSDAIEIETFELPFAGVSIREQGNSITEVDRSRWNASYASFFQELLNQEDKVNPLLWKL